MYNRRSNLNTDNNRIAIVNAYIENANSNRSIIQQMTELMTNQESMLRDLVQNGIMSSENNNAFNSYSTRTTARTDNRNYTPPLSRRRANSETNNINVPQMQRPNSQRTSRSFNTPARQAEERLANMLVSMMMMPSLTGETNELTDDFLTPIIVRPTQQQIERATEVIRYGDITNPPNSTCPITLNHFQDNVNVTRIMYCGHIFSENSLDNWFRENVRCPMCRYDIRNYTGSNIGGNGRRDINASNINDTPEVVDEENEDSLVNGEEENSDSNTNTNTNINSNSNDETNSDTETNNATFPRNSFAGLFTNSISNGNDISNILNTFIGDLQNDPLFTNFSQQGRNGRFDASGNYIFETYIPINFNGHLSNNTNNNN